MAMPVAEEPQRARSPEPVTIGEFRYLRAPRPLHFPDTEKVPETKWHLELRTLVYQFLKLAFASEAHIGCDQFVYWDAANPRVCLAPDAFVRFGGPDELFRSWKVWERGAPQVAVEVISSDDHRDKNWDAKLASYRQLGVRELVRFDQESEGRELRIWDRVENDLVERELSGSAAKSNVLPGFWVLVSQEPLGQTLRLSHDAQGRVLFPTPDEANAERMRADAERMRADAERMRADAERMRADAERIAALEAELLRRQG
jgi:Uma2 family endonuclease